MRNSYYNVIRQSEILAHTLNGEKLSKEDFAEIYNVSGITIDRDLKVLRDLGIQIFNKNNIVKIFNKPPTNGLVNLLAEYLPLKLNSDVFLKKVRPFAKLKNKEFFQYMVLTLKACKEGRLLKIKYKKLSDGIINDYLLKPVRVINSDFNWILHAFKDGSEILQSFYLSRVLSLEMVEKKFRLTPIIEKTDPSYEMIFRFNPKVKNEIQSKLFFEEFTLDENADGFFILKTIQPINNKLASWCVSWWDSIQVIEPKELLLYIDNMICEFAKKNFSKIKD